MNRTKVLLIALAITALGALQLSHFYKSPQRAAGIGTASAMIAMLTGVAIGIYGLTLRRNR